MLDINIASGMLDINMAQTQFIEMLQSYGTPISRCLPAGGRKMKIFMFARACAQGRADTSLTASGHACALKGIIERQKEVFGPQGYINAVILSTQ